MKLSDKAQMEKDKIDSVVNKLCEELKQGHTEEFQKYLKFASQLHKYSWNNQILIMLQCPEARHIASFNTWNKLNRRVKKGSKAIKILVPWFRKFNVEQDGMEKERKVLTGFGVGTVFDVSQTEGEDLPTAFQPLGNDGEKLYFDLKFRMQAKGIKVEEEMLSGGVQGLSYGGLVKIKADLDYTNKLLVLIHEFAHEILHQGSENQKLPRGIKECQAEATAYIVANYLGLESPISRDYLINWGNDADTLRSNVDPVIKASQTIIQMLSKEGQEVSLEESNQEEELAAA